MSQAFSNQFTQHANIQLPLIGGAMYPCSNPELVAAISNAGGIGIVQPISLTYVYGYEFRVGLRYIKSLTNKPIGMNVLIEQSSKTYQKRMRHWINIALQEGVRFFVTSLGKPDWVVDQIHAEKGIVYHDVTEKKWAEKGVQAGVDGLIAVNNRAGGHAGQHPPETLYHTLTEFNLPLICAGGIANPSGFLAVLQMGYAGVQMGTRFIASHECQVNTAYKQAIVNAKSTDIVLSERITGVPVSVINTPGIADMGLTAGPLARWMLHGKKRKHLMRAIYTFKSIWQLKRASIQKSKPQDFWQAGKSVEHISNIDTVDNIISSFQSALNKIKA